MSLSLDRSQWRRVHLGDVVRRSRHQLEPVEKGIGRYVGGGHIDGQSLTITRWGDPSDGQMGSTFRYVFRAGQILFVSARPNLRKCGVVDFEGVVADKTYVLDAVPERGLLQNFLPFVLASERFVDYATREATGSMNPRLLWGPFQRYEFDLPPMEEQQRLADLLWAAEYERRASNSLADEAMRVFRWLLKELCVPQPEDGVDLDAVADFLDSRRVPLSAPQRSVRQGLVPYYGAGGQIDSVDDYLFDEPLVLLCEDGFGLAAWNERPIAYRVDGPSWVNNHAHVLRATGVSTDWLLYSLMHYDLSSLISITVKPKLNQAVARRMQIRKTSSEKGDVRVLDQARALRDAAAFRESQARRLLNSLLSQVFGGV